jgi:hypothetical protein
VKTALKKVIGSFISACVGWFTGVLAMGVFELASASSRDHVWQFLANHAALAAAFVLPIWLLVLLPLYVLLPKDSALWRVPVCTALGVLSGVAVLAICFAVTGVPLSLLWLFGSEAGIIGGVTCLFGALTANRFHEQPTA